MEAPEASGRLRAMLSAVRIMSRSWGPLASASLASSLGRGGGGGALRGGVALLCPRRRVVGVRLRLLLLLGRGVGVRAQRGRARRGVPVHTRMMHVLLLLGRRLGVGQRGVRARGVHAHLHPLLLPLLPHVQHVVARPWGSGRPQQLRPAVGGAEDVVQRRGPPL